MNIADRLKRFDKAFDYTLGSTATALGAAMEGVGLGFLYNFILTGLPQQLLSRPELLADPRVDALIFFSSMSVISALPQALGAGSIEAARS